MSLRTLAQARAAYPWRVESGGTTRWIDERREYFLDAAHVGVRGERHDDCAWVRVLESIYWWPAHEDREWPGAIISVPVWRGSAAPEADAWKHLETALEMDERYRWEAASSDSFREHS